jgi:general secretion pathway protein I
MRRARGFTLLEVLIALAIVAMSVGALLGTVTSSASNIAYLKDKTIAEWVALNRLTEVRIARNMPDVGDRTGNSEMAGMKWQWQEEVTELPVEGLFRVEIRTRPTGETVDDRRPVSKPTSQQDTETSSSSADLKKASWTTVATGVVGSARADRMTAIAAPFAGTAQNQPNNPNNPNNPNDPNNPNNPQPGGAPGNPNSPGTQPPPKGAPVDR